MVIDLLDYAGRRVLVEVGDIETIERMIISVISGDEVLTVTYKDGTEREYDSSDCRNMNFFDFQYEIYNAETGVNKFDIEEFMNRTNTYWLED